MRLLGVDPGLLNTGWGIKDSIQDRITWIASGKISPKSNMEIPERLKTIHEGLNNIINEHQPTSAGIEQIFVNHNGQSTLKLGMARGVAVTSCSLHNLQVKEYSPTTVKKAVTGTGKATKDQVAAMVKILLPGCKYSSEDESDALAIAICHTHYFQANKNIMENYNDS